MGKSLSRYNKVQALSREKFSFAYWMNEFKNLNITTSDITTVTIPGSNILMIKN